MAHDAHGHLSNHHPSRRPDPPFLRTCKAQWTSHWNRYGSGWLTPREILWLTFLDFWFLTIDYAGAFFSLMALGMFTPLSPKPHG